MGVLNRRRFAVLLIGVAVLACCLAFGVPVTQTAGAAESRACGSFRVAGSVFDVTIEKGRVSCDTARSVLRGFLSGKAKLHGPPGGPAYLQTWTLDGWSCGHGTGGGGCIRGGTSYTNAPDYILAEEPA